MRFESQCFWLAKDAEFPEQYQDAYQLDARRGIAAIADGVSSALFSGPWARTLVQGTLAEPPRLDDAERFREWLARQRAELAGQIDVTKLTWYQRPKMAAGAMSTLLWIELTPLPPETPDAVAGAYRLQGYSIGDGCLFHLRGGELLRSFPMSSSADFGLDPKVLVSIDKQQDYLLEFDQFEDTCLPGDLVVLCTDAIGLWALSLFEQGQQVAWDEYWDRSPEAWRDEIFELRRSKQMRYDDTTLLLLRAIEETADLEPAEPVADMGTVEIEIGDIPLIEPDTEDLDEAQLQGETETYEPLVAESDEIVLEGPAEEPQEQSPATAEQKPITEAHDESTKQRDSS